MINPFKKQFYIYSVGEWYNDFDPKYNEWSFGRIEIHKEYEEYSIDEWRYVFPPELNKLFQDYMEKFYSRDINWFELQLAKSIIKNRFNKRPKNA